jgi:starch phosphorylase
MSNIDDLVSPEVQQAMEELRRLALDLRSGWTHSTDELWGRLEPELWRRTQNPWVVLQTVSRERLLGLLAEPQYRLRIADLAAATRDKDAQHRWFRSAGHEGRLSGVAYFSMEFMLSEALPIYAGGLGNVAGDQLKAASDLGVPVYGVGLLYQMGYFRQVIDATGEQQVLLPFNDPGQLPIRPLRRADGEWLRIELVLPGGRIWLRTWQASVGRVQLLLLDSNDAANHPAHRGITNGLYGGGREHRLRQEIVLGIGGWRLVDALGLEPEVCHLNEGHAAFAVLERARVFQQKHRVPFDAALLATRAGNVFTTHTAVAAGFDRFDRQLVQRHLEGYARDELHIPVETLLDLGREGAGADACFNMAFLAARGSGRINGVSRLHRDVSRGVFQPLFPQWPRAEVPIGYVTNGVHMPSWDSPQADALWTAACGRSCWRGTTQAHDAGIARVSDEALWEMRSSARRALVDYVRERIDWQNAMSGDAGHGEPAAIPLFDSHTLTLGFARRFALYKRPDLLLHDPDRLARLLTNPRRPVQLILAGKAHPDDRPGQALITEWIRFVRQPRIREHAVFLSDYDMLLTERLVQGVDLWLNTPRRPWEASGTSGMKVLVNGGLNLSVLDGWWAEAFSPDVGWSIGDGTEGRGEAAQDARDAAELYDLLEQEVVPLFYSRDAEGLPRGWLSRMRASLARLTPQYSAGRSVKEYVENYYIPAAEAFRARSADNALLARSLAASVRRLEAGWNSIAFVASGVEAAPGSLRFSVKVQVADLAALVRVEIYADGETLGGMPFCREMTPTAPTEGATRSYELLVETSRSAGQFTARVVPAIPDLQTPLEIEHVLWQR